MPEFTKYGTDPKMDDLVDSRLWVDRERAAEQGYGLDVLVNDEVWEVRQTVAEQGYGLDILVKDKIWGVRFEVARHGYGLDILIKDKSEFVRSVVAGKRYGLNVLVNDKEKMVREKVAYKGYGLDVLVNDRNQDVRRAVSYYLKKHNYKSIDEWAAAEPENVHKASPQDLKMQEDLKDFIYKIDDSPKLKVESSYDSVDEFFSACNSNSNDFDELIICAVDTKMPLIKIQKTIKENKSEFKFIVDITDENSDRFLIQTTIKSKEQLNTRIQETVEALRAYKDFSKYADDLESCL